MRRIIGLVLGLALLLAIPAAVLNQPKATPLPTPHPGTGGLTCDAAMAQAATASANADRISDLYPAIHSCLTLAQWEAASRAHPDALDGADPVEFLRNACKASVVSAKPLCRLALAP